MDFKQSSPAVKRVMQDLPWIEVFQPSKLGTLYLKQNQKERSSQPVQIVRRTDLDCGRKII